MASVHPFQIMSLKRIAAGMLLGTPRYVHRDDLQLYIPNDMTMQLPKMAFDTPIVLYASRCCPGAVAFAKELAKSSGARKGVKWTRTPPPLLRQAAEKKTPGGKRAFGGKLGLLMDLTLEMTDAEMPETDEPATHVLLYLNKLTFTMEEGKVFAEEIRLAHFNKFPVIMTHENDLERAGCEFAHFFTTTPSDLISGGLYWALAISAFPMPHREVRKSRTLHPHILAPSSH